MVLCTWMTTQVLQVQTNSSWLLKTGKTTHHLCFCYITKLSIVSILADPSKVLAFISVQQKLTTHSSIVFNTSMSITTNDKPIKLCCTHIRLIPVSRIYWYCTNSNKPHLIVQPYVQSNPFGKIILLRK